MAGHSPAAPRRDQTTATVTPGEDLAHVASNVDRAAIARGRQQALSRLRLVMILLIVWPLAAFIAAAAKLHGRELDDARVQVDRAARIAQEQALRLFDTNEMLLARMLDLVGEASEQELLANGERLHLQLARMASGLPQVQGLYVSGADGRALLTSRMPPAPPDILIRQPERHQAGERGEQPLQVSGERIGRADGERAFDISRDRVLPDGTPGGTVHVSLRPEYFSESYAELGRSERGLRMALLRTDGTVLARWPDAAMRGDGMIGEDPLIRRLVGSRFSGDAIADGPANAGDPIHAVRRLGAYPLVVVAAVDRSIIRTRWIRRMALVAAVLVPTLLASAWLAWLGLRRTRVEFGTSDRLQIETERRRRAELALLQSQKLEALGRLTGGVAHDFNNLLAVIASNTEVLKLRSEASSSKQVAAIERAVSSGAKLTRQLLAFARKQPLVLEEVDLRSRLAGLADLIRPLLGRAISLTSTVAADTGTIRVDFAELELAMMNLAVNANDAMEGQGHLAVRVRNAQPGELPAGLTGDFVLIEVEDSGPGVDPAIVDQVFEPFFTTKPVGRGTGLGLAQVRMLCQSSGGEVQLSTTPGRGATFRLFFGRHRLTALPLASQAVPIGLPDCRLLLVEDDDEVAEALESLLEVIDLRVERVARGEDALAMIDGTPRRFDIVLSDIELAGSIDGVELASRLAVRQPPVPTVLMTGYANRLEQALRRGLEVLPKPCSPAVLSEAIRRAVTTSMRRGSA